MDRNSQLLTKIKIRMLQIVPGCAMEDSGTMHALGLTLMGSTPGDLHPVQLVYSGTLSEGSITP